LYLLKRETMTPAQQGTLNGMFEAAFGKRLAPGENITMKQVSKFYALIIRDLEPELPREEQIDVLGEHFKKPKTSK
jgi:hypothetical protein